MKWKISKLANTYQDLLSLYPCLKKFGYTSEDIKDSNGFIMGTNEYIEIGDGIYEGKQLRELQDELNESSFAQGVHKRLILDFEKNHITIMDTNDQFASATIGNCNGPTYSSRTWASYGYSGNNINI